MKALKLIPTLFVFFLVIALAYAAPVTGTVTSTASGLPINNTLIQVFSTAGVLLNSTTSAADGTYTADSVGTGLRIVNATAAGFNTQSLPTFVSGPVTVNFALGPIPASTLSGSESNGLASVNVVVKQGTTTIASTTTDGTGAYLLPVLNGTYTFEATLAGYNSYSATVIVSGNTGHNFVLTLAPTTGTIQGFVRNTTGVLLSGATVRIELGGGVVASTTTNLAGFYTITHAAGAYTSIASRASYLDSSVPLTLTAGQTVNRNFTLAQTVTPPPSGGSGGSGGGSSGGGSGGSSNTNDPLQSGILLNSNTYVWNLEKHGNPFTKTIRPIDVIVFEYEGTSYSLVIDEFKKDGRITFKVSPTSEYRSGYKGDFFDFNIKDKTLVVSIEELTRDEIIESQSLIKLKLFLTEGTPHREVKEPVTVPGKIADGVIKIMGEIAPPADASVPVGIGISAATIVVGLLLFLGMRKFWK
jgi:hypothetical protein